MADIKNLIFFGVTVFFSSKKSSRRLQDNLKTSWKDFFKTSWKIRIYYTSL